MAVQPIPRKERGTLSAALVITRRELRDNLKDWRIVTPVILLTLIFPFLMDGFSTHNAPAYRQGPPFGPRPK